MSTHRKGQIGITGRLQTRIWEKDDIKRKATEVIIDQFQLLSDAKGVVAIPHQPQNDMPEEDTKSANAEQ